MSSIHDFIPHFYFFLFFSSLLIYDLLPLIQITRILQT